MSIELLNFKYFKFHLGWVCRSFKYHYCLDCEFMGLFVKYTAYVYTIMIDIYKVYLYISSSDWKKMVLLGFIYKFTHKVEWLKKKLSNIVMWRILNKFFDSRHKNRPFCKIMKKSLHFVFWSAALDRNMYSNLWSTSAFI